MNSSKIDIIYTQTGNVCVFASYSIIINYFSKGRKKITALLNKYVEVYNTNPTGNSALQLEDSIYHHYHSYCKANKLRGFEFIRDQHLNDKFSTYNYCTPKIIAVNNNHTVLPSHHNISLRKKLKRGGLAMVLYQSGNKLFHSIVIGFDKRKGGFFIRNPQQFQNHPLLSRTDFLKNNDILEYILFERIKRRN